MRGIGLNQLEEKVRFIIYGKEDAPLLLSAFLWGVSKIYGTISKARCVFFSKREKRQHRIPAMVISVGNITLGGTGKTPMTIYLARLLSSMGIPSAIVSRGYKGKKQKEGGIVSDGKDLLLDTRDAGDEPVMMAQSLCGVPVLVNRNRASAAHLAIQSFGVRVILLDDGFQHLKIQRDLDLVLLDSQNPFGNGHLFPRGVLREEPLSIGRADAVIFTRHPAEEQNMNQGTIVDFSFPMPLFHASHRPYIQRVVDKYGQIAHETQLAGKAPDAEWFRGKRVVAFSGIGRNDDFQKTIENFGCHILAFFGFPDHHRYRLNDWEHVIASGLKENADLILTTEKDAVRLPDEIDWRIPMVVIGIHITFKDDAFENFIKNRISDYFRKQKTLQIYSRNGMKNE